MVGNPTSASPATLASDDDAREDEESRGNATSSIPELPEPLSDLEELKKLPLPSSLPSSYSDPIHQIHPMHENLLHVRLKKDTTKDAQISSLPLPSVDPSARANPAAGSCRVPSRGCACAAATATSAVITKTTATGKARHGTSPGPLRRCSRSCVHIYTVTEGDVNTGVRPMRESSIYTRLVDRHFVVPVPFACVGVRACVCVCELCPPTTALTHTQGSIIR